MRPSDAAISIFQSRSRSIGLRFRCRWNFDCVSRNRPHPVQSPAKWLPSILADYCGTANQFHDPANTGALPAAWGADMNAVELFFFLLPFFGLAAGVAQRFLWGTKVQLAIRGWESIGWGHVAGHHLFTVVGIAGVNVR
jgi:hypothetical protein